MVDEMLTRLLLTRSIAHQIDLIPGLSLPNKEPQRVKLIENVELKWQVLNLLDRGLIKEILSSFVVPIVLAPKKEGE